MTTQQAVVFNFKKFVLILFFVLCFFFYSN